MTTPSSRLQAQALITKVQASSKSHIRFAKQMYLQPEQYYLLSTQVGINTFQEKNTQISHEGLSTGLHPQEVIDDTMAGIQHPKLREFLKAVAQEPEVNYLMCMRRNPSARKQQYGVECLHLAAREASCFKAIAPQQREVVYAATILLGCRTLIAPCKESQSTPDDILFTIVRQALHRLDKSAPKQARLLRLCMGWGNEEETQSDIFLGLKQIIYRSLERALKVNGDEAN